MVQFADKCKAVLFKNTSGCILFWQGMGADTFNSRVRKRKIGKCLGGLRCITAAFEHRHNAVSDLDFSALIRWSDKCGVSNNELRIFFNNGKSVAPDVDCRRRTEHIDIIGSDLRPEKEFARAVRGGKTKRVAEFRSSFDKC